MSPTEISSTAEHNRGNVKNGKAVAANRENAPLEGGHAQGKSSSGRRQRPFDKNLNHQTMGEGESEAPKASPHMESSGLSGEGNAQGNKLSRRQRQRKKKKQKQAEETLQNHENGEVGTPTPEDGTTPSPEDGSNIPPDDGKTPPPEDGTVGTADTEPSGPGPETSVSENDREKQFSKSKARKLRRKKNKSQSKEESNGKADSSTVANGHESNDKPHTVVVQEQQTVKHVPAEAQKTTTTKLKKKAAKKLHTTGNDRNMHTKDAANENQITKSEKLDKASISSDSKEKIGVTEQRSAGPEQLTKSEIVSPVLEAPISTKMESSLKEVVIADLKENATKGAAEDAISTAEDIQRTAATTKPEASKETGSAKKEVIVGAPEDVATKSENLVDVTAEIATEKTSEDVATSSNNIQDVTAAIATESIKTDAPTSSLSASKNEPTRETTREVIRADPKEDATIVASEAIVSKTEDIQTTDATTKSVASEETSSPKIEVIVGAPEDIANKSENNQAVTAEIARESMGTSKDVATNSENIQEVIGEIATESIRTDEPASSPSSSKNVSTGETTKDVIIADPKEDARMVASEDVTSETEDIQTTGATVESVASEETDSAKIEVIVGESEAVATKSETIQNLTADIAPEGMKTSADVGAKFENIQDVTADSATESMKTSEDVATSSENIQDVTAEMATKNISIDAPANPSSASKNVSTIETSSADTSLAAAPTTSSPPPADVCKDNRDSITTTVGNEKADMGMPSNGPEKVDSSLLDNKKPVSSPEQQTQMIGDDIVQSSNAAICAQKSTMTASTAVDATDKKVNAYVDDNDGSKSDKCECSVCTIM